MRALFLLVFTVMSLQANDRIAEVDAARFVNFGLAGLNEEFLNKPGNVIYSVEDAQIPSEVTPVFWLSAR